MKHILCGFVISLIAVAQVQADDLSVKKPCDTCNGFYWYQKDLPPEEQKTDPEEPALPNPYIPNPLATRYTPRQLMEMHPRVIEVLAKQYQDKAIWKPTPENCGDYMVVQDVVRRKGARFANAMTYFIQTHEEYNLMKDNPVGVPGHNAYLAANKVDMEKTIHEARKEFGFFYFYSNSCPYCQAFESTTLGFFNDKYGWKIHLVDKDEESESALRFNVQTTPTLILAYPAKDKWMPVTVGYVAFDELEEKLYHTIRYLRGEIDEAQWYLNGLSAGGAFDPNHIPDNPNAVKISAEEPHEDR